MKILITGSTGLLGQALSLKLASAASVVGVSRHAPQGAWPGMHLVCDLTEALQVRRLMEREGFFDAVIHTQALSDVDRCEREPALALLQNAQATCNLVDACEGSSTRFFYISTDYVFDGQSQVPYDEQSPINPISVYGRSKAEGERAALRLAKGVVIRPSTLFGPARSNFCDAIVNALKSGQPVSAFQDQTTSPTYSEDCAEALALLVQRFIAAGKPPEPRVYHITNSGSCTRVAFAQRIADLLGYPYDLIRPIKMADAGRPAPRPSYSALASIVLPETIGRSLRPWEEALQAYLRHRRWIN